MSQQPNFGEFFSMLSRNANQKKSGQSQKNGSEDCEKMMNQVTGLFEQLMGEMNQPDDSSDTCSDCATSDYSDEPANNDDVTDPTPINEYDDDNNDADVSPISDCPLPAIFPESSPLRSPVPFSKSIPIKTKIPLPTPPMSDMSSDLEDHLSEVSNDIVLESDNMENTDTTENTSDNTESSNDSNDSFSDDDTDDENTNQSEKKPFQFGFDAILGPMKEMIASINTKQIQTQTAQAPIPRITNVDDLVTVLCSYRSIRNGNDDISFSMSSCYMRYHANALLLEIECMKTTNENTTLDLETLFNDRKIMDEFLLFYGCYLEYRCQVLSQQAYEAEIKFENFMTNIGTSHETFPNQEYRPNFNELMQDIVQYSTSLSVSEIQNQS